MAQIHKIRFTKHAREKFDFVKHYGFEVDEEKVLETVRNPTRLDQKNTQYFATKAMDAKYALRVVYEERKDYTCHHLLSSETGAIWRIRSGMMRKQMFSRL